MTSYEIRKSFLEFFSTKNHQVVPSAPLVIKNDPTLMFTNAGMNQFKDIFLGVRPAKYPRVADTQKCLRVSGKHNDLEEVGYDTYHHTLFEMLGNWSLGDPSLPESGYFKEEAIAWAWELLTTVYKIDKNKLYVTVFEGDKVDKLEKDLDAYNFWKKHIAEDRILLSNKKDNFWEMGDIGPCGPCSEIHIDNRPDEDRQKVDGRTLVNKDHPQVVEVWNLVFMQYNRKADGSLEPLPQKHVDTGMGFERLCMALQGKTSNYDTDVFQPLIQFIAKESGKGYGKDDKADVAMRVMADHIRAIAFTIADGQLPSNVGAGYVIRRILRRAVRYAFTFLNIKEPFLYHLVDVLAEQFKDVFPELKSQLAFVKKVIKEEENAFLRTLASGILRFENYAQGESRISGDFAFELYDTFGFPIDLTQLLAREKGLSVDMEGYRQELQKQKDRSRSATAITAGDWVVLDESGENEFVGYDDMLVRTHVVKYREVETKKKKQYQLVLARTPFYPEGGGQVGDTGLLEFAEEKIPVIDTRKENDLIIQFTEKLPSVITGEVKAVVDAEKRFYTASNHTTTHLLQAALKTVLGDHVQQKGSLVNDRHLRFDFSHFAKISDEEIRQVEILVNDKIRENITLDEQRALPIEKAKQMGATALFGEKYGDTVRMITFDPAFSRELCGGTHVQATGMIGFFKIISESAVQAGVRRVEAITGVAALNYVFDVLDNLKELKELLKNPKNVLGSVISLVEENVQLKKELEKAVVEKAATLKNELKDKVENINGINFIAQQVDLPNADAVKNLAYGLKSIIEDLFLVLAAEIDGKAHLSVMISDELVKAKNLNAGTIVRELGREIQGGGGGQPFFATAGGKNPKGLKNALEKAKSYIA